MRTIMRFQRFVWSFALIVLVLAVFAPIVGHEFLKFDDDAVITENTALRAGLTGEGVRWAFSTLYWGNWMPVTWLSHMLDVQVSGFLPGGHHRTSRLLQALNAILLFFVLARMTGAVAPSAFAAAVFAIHPLQVEPVAWAAARRDLLSGLFFVLTLGAYARYVARPSLPRYAAVAIAFALGLASKPMLVTVPFLLLLLDDWPLGRVRGPWPDVRARLPGLILEKVPLLALSGAAAAIAYIAQRKAGAPGEAALSLGTRLANAVVSYALYLKRIVWPVRLSVFYPFVAEDLTAALVFGAFALIAGVTVALVVVRHRRYLLTGWLWFLGMLVPVIGLVAFGQNVAADRFVYLPLIGLALGVSWEADQQWRRPGSRAALVAVGTAAVLALAIRAGDQVRHWHDNFSLFHHAAEVTDGNWLAYNHLGNEYVDQRRLPEAIAAYRKALSLRPSYVGASYNLAGAFLAQGSFEDAATQYRETLRLNPYYAEAYNNLGAALLYLGKSEEAIAYLATAVRYKPGYVDAYVNLGLALEKNGRLNEAIAQFSTALRYDPGSASARTGYNEAMAQRSVTR